MILKKFSDIRSWLREYRYFEKELRLRADYTTDLKRILLSPLSEEDCVLRNIYTRIINEIEDNSQKLLNVMYSIESVLDRLYGAERAVIYYRYILGVEWIKLPEYLMFEQRTCQSYETRALKKIAKMNIEWGDDYVKQEETKIC